MGISKLDSKRPGRPRGLPKTGGRVKGTPNKVSGDLRQFVQTLLDDNRQAIIDDLQTLEPVERLKMYERFLSYVLPKQAHTAADLRINPDHLDDQAAAQLADLIIQKITD